MSDGPWPSPRGCRSGTVAPGDRRGGRTPRRWSSACLELGDYVVDGVAHRLQVLEVLVVNAESHRPLTQLFLQRFYQFDQRQGVGGQVLVEGRSLRDARRLDLEDVGQAVPDQLESLLTVH